MSGTWPAWDKRKDNGHKSRIKTQRGEINSKSRGSLSHHGGSVGALSALNSAAAVDSGETDPGRCKMSIRMGVDTGQGVYGLGLRDGMGTGHSPD